MSTRTQSLLLLLFGAALVRLGASDLLLRFVKESARPWVVVAGGVMLVLAVWSLIVDARHGSPEHADHEHADHEQAAVDEHGHGAASRASWLIVLPVIAVLVIGPPALGRFTVEQRQPTVPLAADYDFPRLPARDPVSLKLFDFALRAASKGRATIADRTVRLTGFVAGRADGGFVLARLVISCCAADASPITVRVRTDGAIPSNDSWVRVTGRYRGQDTGNADVPVLAAAEVTRIAAPAEPYD